MTRARHSGSVGRVSSAYMDRLRRRARHRMQRVPLWMGPPWKPCVFDGGLEGGQVRVRNGLLAEGDRRVERIQG